MSRWLSQSKPCVGTKIDIEPLGDCALLLRLRDNAAAVRAQLQIEAAALEGVIECAAAYETVAVFCDNAAASRMDDLQDRIAKALARRTRNVALTGRRVEIPACFDLEFGIDLEHVATQAQLPVAEVVTLFCRPEYRVACIGFTPGFPYLIGLPERLVTPRHAAPRRAVPGGSIAIGGDQAGIYPTASPGGWNIIGRTSMVLFDPDRESPAALRAGDRVRFRPITPQELTNATPST